MENGNVDGVVTATRIEGKSIISGKWIPSRWIWRKASPGGKLIGKPWKWEKLFLPWKQSKLFKVADYGKEMGSFAGGGGGWNEELALLSSAGFPWSSVLWLKDGQPLRFGSRVRLSSETHVQILSMEKEDRGMYQCVVKSDTETSQGSAEIRLGGEFPPPPINSFSSSSTSSAKGIVIVCRVPPFSSCPTDSGYIQLSPKKSLKLVLYSPETCSSSSLILFFFKIQFPSPDIPLFDFHPREPVPSRPFCLIYASNSLSRPNGKNQTISIIPIQMSTVKGKMCNILASSSSVAVK